MLNLLDFGADPTGATLSDTAIANCLAAVPANGGVINCPPGTYAISQTVTVSQDNVSFIGEGSSAAYFTDNAEIPATRFLWQGVQGGTLFVWTATSTHYPLRRGGLRDIGLDGNQARAGYGLMVLSVVGGLFLNLNVRWCSQTSIHLGVIGGLSSYNAKYNCSYNRFENIFVANNYYNGYGINLDGANQPLPNDANSCFNVFDNLYLGGGNLPMVRLYDADHNRFYNTTIYTSSGYGVVLNCGTAGGTNAGNVFYQLSSQFGGVQRGNAANNYILGYDRLNGQPAFTVENGKSIHISEIHVTNTVRVDDF